MTRRTTSQLNQPGWKNVHGRWLWWDGLRYITPAEQTGQSRPPKRTSYAPAGYILFAVTAVLFWVLGVITGPLMCWLGYQDVQEAKARQTSLVPGGILIGLGVVSLILGMIMVGLVSDPDFQM